MCCGHDQALTLLTHDLTPQDLYDHFWADMENRVRAEGAVAPFVSPRSKCLHSGAGHNAVAELMSFLPPPFFPGVVVRLSKWMSELEQAFYGSCMARARLTPRARAPFPAAPSAATC